MPEAYHTTRARQCWNAPRAVLGERFDCIIFTAAPRIRFHAFSVIGIPVPDRIKRHHQCKQARFGWQSVTLASKVVALIVQGMRSLPASMAAAGLVGQSREALLEKPLYPFVDKAAADANRRGNVGDRHPVSQE